MAYDSDDKPLIRARARRGQNNWRTTGVTAYYFISERPSNMEGKTDRRAYVTIKDLAEQVELRFSWSQINELHAMLGRLMADASNAREDMIAAAN